MNDVDNPADVARRALADLELHARGRADEVAGAVAASQVLRDDDSEAELWARVGRVLRERDPSTFGLLRSLAVSMAAQLDASVEN